MNTRLGRPDAWARSPLRVETAFLMQAEAPAFDLSRSPKTVLDRYGAGTGRRIRATVPAGPPPCRRGWRTGRAGRNFSHLPQLLDARPALYTTNAKKPINWTPLLNDESRGLLHDTLVVFGTEFGRTPAAQGTDGRDHHPHAFSMWLAGGGVKGGLAYGQTDEFGYYVAENKVTVPDFHATVLHLLGLDHTKSTFRHAGRDFRLTDVSGEVVKGILA